MRHFRILSRGVFAPSSCKPKPGCKSTIEVTRNCKSPKQKGNWRAATGRCFQMPLDPDFLFQLDPEEFQHLFDYGTLTAELRGELARRGLRLSEAAALTVAEKGRKWYVTDEDRMAAFVRLPPGILCYQTLGRRSGPKERSRPRADASQQTQRRL